VARRVEVVNNSQNCGVFKRLSTGTFRPQPGAQTQQFQPLTGCLFQKIAPISAGTIRRINVKRYTRKSGKFERKRRKRKDKGKNRVKRRKINFKKGKK
jgi:hypothetical protein